MKYMVTVFGLFLFALILALWAETESRFDEVENKQATEVYFLKEEIEEQKKEIRLLKTDMEIMEKGYERYTEN